MQAREEAKAKMGLADVAEKPLTVPQPFNLTKPGLRKVPEPMKIDQASLKMTGSGEVGLLRSVAVGIATSLRLVLRVSRVILDAYV